MARETVRDQLRRLYAAALLENPPVYSVGRDVAAREENARRLARKDVDRLLNAVALAGLAITLGPQPQQKLELEEVPDGD